VFLVALCLAIAGGVLLVEAGPLATRWESGQGISVGFTDPARRQGYQVLGAVLLAAGAVGLGLAAWRWMERRDGRHRPG
jgi:hypothetical protein